MKKILLLALLALGALLTAACGSDAAQTSGDAAKAAPVSEPSSAGAPAASQQPAGKGKVLVAYFSRAGENYRVGYIKKGNTHNSDARPALSGKVENWQDYDTVFLGYPIWWSDMPMAVYTFMESYDWTGKTIIPFCTSAGNVMTGRESDIPEFAKGAAVKEGLGLEGKRVQEQPDAVRPQVEAWLASLGYKK